MSDTRTSMLPRQASGGLDRLRETVAIAACGHADRALLGEQQHRLTLAAQPVVAHLVRALVFPARDALLQRAVDRDRLCEPALAGARDGLLDRGGARLQLHQADFLAVDMQLVRV